MRSSAGSHARRSDRGLERTAGWFSTLPDKDRYHQASKRLGLDTKHSVSAVVACYNDNRAIPIMHERLRAVFGKLNVDYEIIFVNDCSPDDSEEVIRRLSSDDRRVIGISHSATSDPQAAFRSGMDIASKTRVSCSTVTCRIHRSSSSSSSPNGVKATMSSTVAGSSAKHPF